MSTVNHTEELQAIAEKIAELGPQVECVALDCARNMDIAGLVFVANMALGRPSRMAMRMGLAMDLADFIQGISPRVVHGVERA